MAAADGTLAAQFARAALTPCHGGRVPYRRERPHRHAARRAAHLPAAARFQSSGPCEGRRPVPSSASGPGRLLGGLGAPARVVPSVGQSARVAAPARQVVPGRNAQRLRELPRPPCARRSGRQGCPHLGGGARAAGGTPALVPRAPRTGEPVRECAQEPGRPAGRTRRDLHGDGARGRRRDARVCAHRSAPHRGVRRILRRVLAGPHQRLRSEGPRHGRRRLSPRQRRALEGQRR